MPVIPDYFFSKVLCQICFSLLMGQEPTQWYVLDPGVIHDLVLDGIVALSSSYSRFLFQRVRFVGVEHQDNLVKLCCQCHEVVIEVLTKIFDCRDGPSFLCHLLDKHHAIDNRNFLILVRCRRYQFCISSVNCLST